MTISGVLVAAPWIVFGAGLAMICIQLLLASRRASDRQRRRSEPFSPLRAARRSGRACAGHGLGKRDPDNSQSQNARRTKRA